MGIGRYTPDTNRRNADNQFKLRLLAIEDKLYQSDLEVARAEHLIRCIQSNLPKSAILKMAEHAGVYDDVINEDTDLEASLRTLKGIVCSQARNFDLQQAERLPATGEAGGGVAAAVQRPKIGERGAG